MSLVLNQGTRPRVTLKTFDAKTLLILLPDSTTVTVTAADFVSLVEYVLTNADLEGPDDYRLALIERIKRSKITSGWNKGSRRISL